MADTARGRKGALWKAEWGTAWVLYLLPQLEGWCFYWFWEPLISLSHGRRRELQGLPSRGSTCFMPAAIQVEKHSWSGADLLNFTGVPHHPRAVSAFQTHKAVLQALQHIWAVQQPSGEQKTSIWVLIAVRRFGPAETHASAPWLPTLNLLYPGVLSVLIVPAVFQPNGEEDVLRYYSTR